MDPGPCSPFVVLGMDPAASTQLCQARSATAGLHPIAKVSWSGHHSFLKLPPVLATHQVKEEGKKGKGWQLVVAVMVFHHFFSSATNTKLGSNFVFLLFYQHISGDSRMLDEVQVV